MLYEKWSFIKYVRKIFRKTNISYRLIRTRTCVYQGVRNISFSENFVYVLIEGPQSNITSTAKWCNAIQWCLFFRCVQLPKKHCSVVLITNTYSKKFISNLKKNKARMLHELIYRKFRPSQKQSCSKGIAELLKIVIRA